MPSPHPLPHTRTPCLLFTTAVAASRYVAREIDKLVRARNAVGKPTVLGLATGSTPVGLYRELIRLHKDEGLDFSQVVTFNLDEYFPMPKEDSHSYFRWMHETFFNHVNIRWQNIHIPDGTLPVEEVDGFCAEYERKIKAAGGVDIQILGIGRTGHIGFNEPGSPKNSRTRMVTLDSITRRASRMVATPIVIAWFGTFSSPKNPLAASRRVMLSSVTRRVRLFRGLPGSLKPMCPVRPMPRIWMSMPPAARIFRS